jgi:hypothetical protein
MKRFAFTIGGELRNFKTSSRLFEFYKEFLEKNDIQVDFFGCFWESDYTAKCKRAGYFDFLTDYTVEEVPKEGIDLNLPKKLDDNITGKSNSLYNWSYSCYKSNYLRKHYQIKNRIEYDLVSFSRPDIYVPFKILKRIAVDIHELDSSIIDAVDFTIYTPPIKKNYGYEKGTDYHLHCDDLKVVGDQCAMDIFSTSFHLIYIKNDPSYVGSYHNLPAFTIKKYGLEVRNDCAFDKKWKILRKDNGIDVTDSMKIDKEYVNWLESR